MHTRPASLLMTPPLTLCTTCLLTLTVYAHRVSMHCPCMCDRAVVTTQVDADEEHRQGVEQVHEGIYRWKATSRVKAGVMPDEEGRLDEEASEDANSTWGRWW